MFLDLIKGQRSKLMQTQWFGLDPIQICVMWFLAWHDVDITTNIGRADMANLKLDAWHSRARWAHESRGMNRGT